MSMIFRDILIEQLSKRVPRFLEVKGKVGRTRFHLPQECFALLPSLLFPPFQNRIAIIRAKLSEVLDIVANAFHKFYSFCISLGI